MGIRQEKTTNTIGNGNPWLSQVSPGFPRFSPYMFFLHILVLWEIDGELTHFTYDEVYHKMRIGWEKKHPYYGKIMSTSIPGSLHLMGFVSFSCTMGNLWENPCISCITRFVNFFQCRIGFAQCQNSINEVLLSNYSIILLLFYDEKNLLMNLYL